MPYINRYEYRKQKDGIETVDEFESMAEARKMLEEYKISDPSAHYGISQRSTKAWREAS